MKNTHSQHAPGSRQNHFVIPYEIRHHPKLDQATKFTWVYVWELANFRPDTIITSYARLASDLGRTERCARRWIKCLAEAGLIEMVDSKRKGELVLYVLAPQSWEDEPPPPSVHKVFGESVTDSPDEKEDCGGSVTDPPISSPSEEKEKFILERERAENAALQLIIERRRAQMPRDPLGISGDGTEIANCEQSRVLNSQGTVNSLQLNNTGNAGAPIAEPPPQSRGPRSVEVNSILARSSTQASKDSPSRTEKVSDATFQWLREQFPDEEDVYPQFLLSCAQAVAFGHLSKEKLYELVGKSKLDRIKQPGRHFCSTMRHYLPKKKPR